MWLHMPLTNDVARLLFVFVHVCVSTSSSLCGGNDDVHWYDYRFKWTDNEVSQSCLGRSFISLCGCCCQCSNQQHEGKINCTVNDVTQIRCGKKINEQRMKKLKEEIVKKMIWNFQLSFLLLLLLISLQSSKLVVGFLFQKVEKSGIKRKRKNKIQ